MKAFSRSHVSLRALAGAIASIVTVAATSSALAAPAAFADFTLVTADQPFHFTNNGGTGANIQVSNAAVLFDFTTESGLPTGDHAGFLNITPVGGVSTFTPASGGTTIVQPIDQAEQLTLTSGTNGTGTNYLTLLFSGRLSGTGGAASANLSGSDGTSDTVTYTSDFGTFSSTGNSYNLGLSSLSPNIHWARRLPEQFRGGYRRSIYGQVHGA